MKNKNWSMFGWIFCLLRKYQMLFHWAHILNYNFVSTVAVDGECVCATVVVACSVLVCERHSDRLLKCCVIKGWDFIFRCLLSFRSSNPFSSRFFFVGFLQCTKSCSFYVNCSAFLRQLNEILWTGNERGKMGKFTRPLSRGYRIIVMSLSNEKASLCHIFRWSCFMHEQCCLRSSWNEFR